MYNELSANEHFPIGIIGCGPAGIATAIQLARSGFPPVIFEKDEPGGSLRNANLVENYPGFPAGISGMELAARIASQLLPHQVRIMPEEVRSLDYVDHRFTMHTSRSRYTAEIVVVATGTKPRRLEEAMLGTIPRDRIHYDVMDLKNVVEKNIIIIGAGDLAFDYALGLSKNNFVHLLNRSTQPKCLSLLWERACSAGAISYQSDVRIESFEDKPSPITIHCVIDGSNSVLFGDYLLIAIGRKPQLDVLHDAIRSQLDFLQSKGALYFAGDVHNNIFRQTAIAVGDGVRVAMQITERMKQR